MDFHISLSSLDNHFSSIPSIPANMPEQVFDLLRHIADFRRILLRMDRQITFFGTMKAGKSTLLNAIMGTTLLPTKANRATGVITKICYAQQPSAFILRKTSNNGSREEKIEFDEIAKYILLDTSGTTSKAPAGIEEVSIRIPLPIVKNGCTLTDTPGLMDNQSLTDRCYQELERSDLAVMILAADKLLSSYEKEAAKKVHDLLSGNIVFVVNRLDLLDDDRDREEITDWAKTALKELGNGFIGQPKIFATEAKVTLEAKRNGTERKLAKDGLLEFEQWLRDLFNFSTGGKIVILSRLGILENHLIRAYSYFQTQLSEAEITLNKLKKEEEGVLAEKQATFKRAVSEARLNLAKMKSEFEDISSFEPAIAELIKGAWLIIRSGGSWRREVINMLSECSQDCLIKYFNQDFIKDVNSAVCQTGMKVPAYNLNQSKMNTIISEATNVLNGTDNPIDWIADIFTNHIIKGAVETVQKSLRSIVSIFCTEAKNYIDRIDKMLVDFAETNKPKPMTSPALYAAWESKQFYTNLISWCNKFQNAVSDLKKEITG